MTGTASHFNKIIAARPIIARIYFGALFAKLKSLNFMLINGRLLTIKKEVIIIIK